MYSDVDLRHGIKYGRLGRVAAVGLVEAAMAGERVGMLMCRVISWRVSGWEVCICVDTSERLGMKTSAPIRGREDSRVLVLLPQL